jgi:hypothetical protein
MHTNTNRTNMAAEDTNTDIDIGIDTKGSIATAAAHPAALDKTNMQIHTRIYTTIVHTKTSPKLRV